MKKSKLSKEKLRMLILEELENLFREAFTDQNQKNNSKSKQ
jgi:hypothetical protein